MLKIPSLNPEIFKPRPFAGELSGSSIITLLKIDTGLDQVIIGDGSTSILHIFDFEGHQLDQIQLSSPPTDVNTHKTFYDLTLTGILHPNNLNKGSIARLSIQQEPDPPTLTTLIDSLYRPVRCLIKDFTGDGRDDYLVCEYGNDIGQLAFYKSLPDGNYQRRIIEAIPGSIALDVHDLNHDGFEDIMVLYAQGDERIVIYFNDGKGGFNSIPQIIRRFPSVYGSMYMKLYDFNRDGFMDILYVNGDNFDHSQILKPYHGIRIFENDGENRFERKYFYPIYGAAKAQAHDFDLDGDLDLIVASNFADLQNNPERGIMYFECTGPYQYDPYAIEASKENQWNTMDIGDIDQDGDDDVIIGAMYLQNVLKIQKVDTRDNLEQKKSALILLENQLYH